MSNFSKNILATFVKHTHSVEPFSGDFNIETINPNTDKSNRYLLYKLGVKLEVQYQVSEYTDKKSISQVDMVADLKRNLIENMFGEFRPHILDLRSALYDRDIEKAVTIAHRLEKQMYE
jgi:hypothetical protein